MQTQCSFDFTGNLIANSFSRIFTTKSADLSWGFSQTVSDIHKTEFSLSQDSSEIFKSSVRNFHEEILNPITY